MIVDDSTLVPDKSKGTSLKSNSLVEELRTMVINSDGEDDSTMKSMCLKKFLWLKQVDYFLFLYNMFVVLGHDTGPEESGKKYRPLFLDHFDKKIAEKSKVIIVNYLQFICNIVHIDPIFIL